MDDATPLVVDNGSGVLKAGFAGDEAPSNVFPCIVGYPKHQNAFTTEGVSSFVGNEALAKRGVLMLEYPVARGVITSWDAVEKIWNHTFRDELQVNPSEHPVLLTEAPLNPKINREKMISCMFEVFDVLGAFIQIQAVLALYASGRTTGVVMDCGDGVSHTVPIYEGYAVPHAVDRLDLAGRDLSEFLTKILLNCGCFLKSSAEREVAREMKEKLCYVALDYKEELEHVSEVQASYELPDGEIVTVGKERFECPEALFNTLMVGKEGKGIHALTHSAISNCDYDARRELYRNVVLSGGSTMFRGMSARMKNELRRLAEKPLKVGVVSPPERNFAVWRGGSMLSSLSTFRSMWIDRDEFEETGASIVRRKCD